jgi:drug/metabolite transporter (DMT)-like permease
MTAFLALLSSVFIGSADFVGGAASRTANGVRVATFIAIMCVPLALVVSLSYGAEHVSRGDAIWSALSGIVVAFGIGCFYLGMGRGLISVVAPVAAVTGAVIPVVYGLVRGERPGAPALVGLVVAFVAVAVVSIAQSEQHPETLVGVDRHVIGLALAAGVFFGLYYITLSRVSDDAGLWPVTISRAAGSVALVILALALTRGVLGGVTQLWRTVLLIAVLAISAMVPLLLALQRGPVAIASVLASLYPVTTVLLAAFVLRERLSRLQYVGVACALVSVALVSTG